VPAAMLDELRALARAAAPNEACALLSGPEPHVASRLHAARNAELSPYRFEVDPNDLVRIVHAIEAAGERLVAIAHSHPAGTAAPSATDLREARWDAVQLIVGSDGTIRAWRYADGQAAEVTIRATSPG
jgi:proteasome lid subunit RPN8/RPN11